LEGGVDVVERAAARGSEDKGKDEPARRDELRMACEWFARTATMAGEDYLNVNNEERVSTLLALPQNMYDGDWRRGESGEEERGSGSRLSTAPQRHLRP
jgi:hypothetical protein